MSLSAAETPKNNAEEKPREINWKGRRGSSRAYLVLGIITVIGVVAYLGYGLLAGGKETTDNAQLEADVVPLAPKVGGTVLHLHVTDNQVVKAGDLIAEIDPRDYEIRIAQAEAEYHAAKAQAETSLGKNSRVSVAQIAAAEAALTRAEADYKHTENDLGRARSLKEQNAITAVEYENAQSTATKARAARDEARAKLKLAEEQHGFASAKVKSAEAALNQARAQLDYTKIYAPRDGSLSKIAVQEGQIVQPGQTLAQLVSNDTFLVANFKETQIGQMHPGQHAEIMVDAYPGHHFKGEVISLAAATGARFSLLPPDNASGNFVKVVQRVPVKIKLDGSEVGSVPLKAGLSAEVTVIVR
jgi:membrane fusion protein (multidrug efflux system)